MCVPYKTASDSMELKAHMVVSCYMDAENPGSQEQPVPLPAEPSILYLALKALFRLLCRLCPCQS